MTPRRPSFDLLAFGEALYRWRTALGWSQARLAREIDVDVASPMRWENGRNKPHQRLVNRLRALGFVPPTTTTSPSAMT